MYSEKNMICFPLLTLGTEYPLTTVIGYTKTSRLRPSRVGVTAEERKGNIGKSNTNI